MQVIKSHNIVFFDVDETLVLWDAPEEEKTLLICSEEDNIVANVKPHLKHIQQLKRHKARGHTVVVWSKGGWNWAKTVVECLELTEHVDYVMSKPDWYYDDIDASDCPERVVGERVYYAEEDKGEPLYCDVCGLDHSPCSLVLPVSETRTEDSEAYT